MDRVWLVLIFLLLSVPGCGGGSTAVASEDASASEGDASARESDGGEVVALDETSIEALARQELVAYRQVERQLELERFKQEDCERALVLLGDLQSDRSELGKKLVELTFV